MAADQSDFRFLTAPKGPALALVKTKLLGCWPGLARDLRTAQYSTVQYTV